MVVASICHPSAGEVTAAESGVQGHPLGQSESEKENARQKRSSPGWRGDGRLEKKQQSLTGEAAGHKELQRKRCLTSNWD